LIVDFITKLPLVAGKNVICDILPKITYFVAAIKRTSAKELVRLFRDNMWKLHGFPKSVFSDRGLQFAAKLTKKLKKMSGIKTKLLTSFYSQTNS